MHRALQAGVELVPSKRPDPALDLLVRRAASRVARSDADGPGPASLKAAAVQTVLPERDDGPTLGDLRRNDKVEGGRLLMG